MPTVHYNMGGIPTNYRTEVLRPTPSDPDAVDWARSFYTCAGKVCLVMDDEVPGFVGNRLQEALWREALHMIDAGEAIIIQTPTAGGYGKA